MTCWYIYTYTHKHIYIYKMLKSSFSHHKVFSINCITKIVKLWFFLSILVTQDQNWRSQNFIGVPLWLSGLRIWHCYCNSVLNRCCGSGSIPGPGTFTCLQHGQKQKQNITFLSFYSQFDLIPSLLDFYTYFWYFMQICCIEIKISKLRK